MSIGERVKGFVRSVAAARDRHRARHTPTGFSFCLADSISYLDAAAWDRCTAGASVFLSRAYLDTTERSGPAELAHRYALIYRGRDPVAAVAMQLLEITGDRFMQGAGAEAKASTAMRLAAKALGGIKDRVLVCGNLMTCGPHGVAFAPGGDPAELWPAVAEAIYKVRRADRLAGDPNYALVKDLEPGQAGVDALSTYSYRPLKTDPDMVLDLPAKWKSLEDYLASLTSKYRGNARNVLRRVESSGAKVERLADPRPEAAKLHALYLQVHRNAAIRPVTFPPDYLPSLAGALGESFRCTVVRKRGEIVAFVVTLKDGETAVGYYLGFDRGASAEMPIYLRLLYATIDDAISLGCRRLSLCRTALDPKARLGAKPKPLAIWVRHRVPALNLLVRGLMPWVPSEEAPDRGALKAEIGKE